MAIAKIPANLLSVFAKMPEKQFVAALSQERSPVSVPKKGSSEVSMQKVAAFRYVDDFLRAIVRMNDEVNILIQEGRQHRKLLKASFVQTANGQVIIIDPTGSTGSPHINTKKPDMIKKLPLKKMESSYGVIRRLYDKFHDLQVMEAELTTKFSDESPEAVKKAMSGITVLKKKIQMELQAAFSVLSEIGLSNEPADFSSICGAIANALEKGLTYREASNYVYVYTLDDQITFSRYFYLRDCVDDKKKLFKNIIVVVSCVVLAEGLKYYMNIQSEFQAPGAFKLGKEFQDAKHAVKLAGMILDADNYENSLSKLPISLYLNVRSLSPGLFMYQNYIDGKLLFDEDWIGFPLKKTVRPDDSDLINKISTQINLELQALSRATRARLRASKVVENKQVTLMFYFVRSGGERRAEPDDLEFLKTRFGVSDSALEQIVKTINMED